MPELDKLDWHLAIGIWHWPFSGLVVYLLLPPLGQPNLYNTDGLYKR